MTDVADGQPPLKKVQKRMDYIRERLKDIRAERDRLSEELAALKDEMQKLRGE